jgi:hypothetical protein
VCSSSATAGGPAALFERFSRAEGGRERGKAGAGLGLAIVAAIVDAHGGTVSAADAVGGAAVFSVVLPVGADAGTAAARAGALPWRVAVLSAAAVSRARRARRRRAVRRFVAVRCGT